MLSARILNVMARAVLGCGSVAALACGGGNGNGTGPTGPQPLQVSGVWIETSQIVVDECNILPATVTTTFTLQHNGTSLVATFSGIQVTGTIDTETGEFTLSTDVNGTVQVQSGRFTSDSRYEAETTVTLPNGCRIETEDSGRRESTGGDGGDGNGGAIAGTYEGDHSFTFGGIAIGTCTGRVVIDGVTGGSFSGTLTVDAQGQCQAFGDTGTITGTTDGSEIRIDLDGFGLEELLAEIGCQPTGGETLFLGRIEGATLRVTLTREFACPDQGVTGQATWSIEATRS